MTTEAVVDFLRSWIFDRTGVICAEDDDLFSQAGLDSLDFAELLGDLERDLFMRLDVAKIINWDDLKSIHGIAENLQDSRTVT